MNQSKKEIHRAPTGEYKTIGKKIHTLVKENTPCCHKIRQECSFTQKTSIFSVLLCLLPHCHANIGRQVRLIPPNTYQEI